MKISARERHLILAAGVLISAFILYAAVLRSKAGNEVRPASNLADAESFAVVSAQLQEKSQRVEQAAILQEKLKIKFPLAGLDEQNQLFVKSLEEAAKQTGIKYTTFNPRAASGGSSALKAGSKSEFDLKFGTTHGGLVKFITSLEEKRLPFSVNHLALKSNGGPDKLEVHLTIAFTFLEPIIDAEKDA